MKKIFAICSLLFAAFGCGTDTTYKVIPYATNPNTNKLDYFSIYNYGQSMSCYVEDPETKQVKKLNIGIPHVSQVFCDSATPYIQVITYGDINKADDYVWYSKADMSPFGNIFTVTKKVKDTTTVINAPNQHPK